MSLLRARQLYPGHQGLQVGRISFGTRLYLYKILVRIVLITIDCISNLAKVVTEVRFPVPDYGHAFERQSNSRQDQQDRAGDH